MFNSAILLFENHGVLYICGVLIILSFGIWFHFEEKRREEGE